MYHIWQINAKNLVTNVGHSANAGLKKTTQNVLNFHGGHLEIQYGRHIVLRDIDNKIPWPQKHRNRHKKWVSSCSRSHNITNSRKICHSDDPFWWPTPWWISICLVNIPWVNFGQLFFSGVQICQNNCNCKPLYPILSNLNLFWTFIDSAKVR